MLPPALSLEGARTGASLNELSPPDELATVASVCDANAVIWWRFPFAFSRSRID
jgi:hypothetical protein